jgi:hypothetical protein
MKLDIKIISGLEVEYFVASFSPCRNVVITIVVFIGFPLVVMVVVKLQSIIPCYREQFNRHYQARNMADIVKHQK